MTTRLAGRNEEPLSGGLGDMTYIVIWGFTAIISAIVGGMLAVMKNRNYSSWAAWCFLFPPFVLAILMTPKNTGPPPPRRRLGDDGDPDRSFL